MARFIPQSGQRGERLELPAGWRPLCGLFQCGVALADQPLHCLLHFSKFFRIGFLPHQVLNQPVHTRDEPMARGIHRLTG